MEKYLSSGGSRGGARGPGGPAPPPPAYFQTKLRPEGPKKNFGDRPLISLHCAGPIDLSFHLIKPVFRLPTDHFYRLKNNMFLLTVTFENPMLHYLQPA